MNRLLLGKAVLIDMDGVLYRGDEAIRGADTFIQQLQTNGNPYLYVTNNSRFTIDTFIEKLASVGIEAEADSVFTSALATTQVLRAEIGVAGTAYVIGGPGMHEALEHDGWKIRAEEAQPDAKMLLDPKSIDAVIVAEGYELTAGRMEQAVNLVANNIPFFATNPDVSIPGPGGSILLGCGCLYSGIERATGRMARVIGKPEPVLYEQAMAKLGASTHNTVMIGDRLDTDILGANKLGMQGILVLSGATTQEQAKSADPKPDLVVNSVIDLV